MGESRKENELMKKKKKKDRKQGNWALWLFLAEGGKQCCWVEGNKQFAKEAEKSKCMSALVTY